MTAPLSETLRRLILLPLLALFVFGTVGGSAHVLCLGSDGHVEMEVGRFGTCRDGAVDSFAAEVSAAMGFSSADSHCGDCRDLPLDRHSLGSSRHGRDPNESIAVTAAFPSALPRCVYAPASFTHAAVVDPPRARCPERLALRI